MCQFDRDSLAITFPAGIGSTQTVITDVPSSVTPFELGTITSITGLNTGLNRTIATFVSGGTVAVKLAFLFPIAAGDQFKLLPGCNRTMATCANIFNNAANFGGFPFIPTPETAV